MKRFFLLVFLNLTLFSVFCENLKIDFRLNLKSEDIKNHLNIVYDDSNEKKTNKDYFDAISGASKNHSTRFLQKTHLDSQNKKIYPKGLKSLLLFAVSDFSFIEKDALKVERDSENTKKITITFNHRKNFYKIESDDNFLYVNYFEKKAQTPKNSFKISEYSPNAQNDEEKNTKEKENEKNDEEQIIEYKDESFEDTAKFYSGKLKINEQLGILTIKGTLKLIEKPSIEDFDDFEGPETEIEQAEQKENIEEKSVDNSINDSKDKKIEQSKEENLNQTSEKPKAEKEQSFDEMLESLKNSGKKRRNQ